MPGASPMTKEADKTDCSGLDKVVFPIYARCSCPIHWYVALRHARASTVVSYDDIVALQGS